MKILSTLTKATLPTVPVYNTLDIVGNTFGRYFDYKRDIKRIEHETQKVKSQAKIIVKQIDTKLKKSLDRNDKNFKKEMFRLQTIAKSLESNANNKNEILQNIAELTEKLSDKSMPLSVKETIPQLIMMAHNSLAEERGESLQKLNLMQGFDPDTKLIGGE